MNQPRRILHVISRLDGYGGARMLRYLAPHDASRGDQTIVVALAADVAIVDELESAGVQVHVLDSRWIIDPFAVARLRRLRRRAPVDFVHAWDATAHAYALLTGREPLSVERCESALTSAWAIRFFGHSLTTTPRGVPPSQPSKRDRLSILTEFGLPHDAIVIAVAGPLVRRKQVDEAIWCFELVRLLHPQARLVVFGDGPDRARLERFAQAVSEPGCVRFVGYRNDLPELLPHADAYWRLDPSRSTPHALLEAMAAAVPAVVSDVPAHRAAAAPGETACVVPLNNRAEVARATDKLLSDAAFAKRLGHNGAQHVVRQFSLEDAYLKWDHGVGRQPIPRVPVTLPVEMP
jgi:glycosyltransferase involved in cell wall biosynthesis